MGEAFHHGGWGMFPTSFIGLVLLATAAMYWQKPDRRRRAVVKNLEVMTLMSGVLGFVTGVIKTFMAVGDADPRLAIVGTGESLNNIGLALCILILARILITLGSARDTSAPSELVDPRA